MRFTAAAKSLAAGEAIEEVVLWQRALELLYCTALSLVILVYSKNLHHSLASQRKTTDRSVHGDVDGIRFNFRTSIDMFGWIRSSRNTADAGTKLKSALVDSLFLTLTTGLMNYNLSLLEVARRNRPLH